MTTPPGSGPREWTVKIENADGKNSVWFGRVVPKVDYEAQKFELDRTHSALLEAQGEIAAKDLLIAQMRMQLSMTNSNWPHEKGLQERITALEGERASLRERVEKHAEAYAPDIFPDDGREPCQTTAGRMGRHMCKVFLDYMSEIQSHKKAGQT